MDEPMSDNILPQTKHPKLIVVVAFDRGEDGELFPAFGPARGSDPLQSFDALEFSRLGLFANPALSVRAGSRPRRRIATVSRR
jgi:hypothetical protein